MLALSAPAWATDDSTPQRFLADYYGEIEQHTDVQSILAHHVNQEPDFAKKLQALYSLAQDLRICMTTSALEPSGDRIRVPHEVHFRFRDPTNEFNFVTISTYAVLVPTSGSFQIGEHGQLLPAACATPPCSGSCPTPPPWAQRGLLKLFFQARTPPPSLTGALCKRCFCQADLCQADAGGLLERVVAQSDGVLRCADDPHLVSGNAR